MAGRLLCGLTGRLLLAVTAASMVYLLAATTLRPHANFEAMTPRPAPAVVQARLAALNLDPAEPVARRYVRWASGAVRGDFGRGWRGDPIGPELWRRAGVTLRLVTAGMLLGGVLGVLAGVVSAAGRPGPVDRLITALSLAVLALPVFVLAVLVQLAAQRVNDLTGMRIFAWTGEYTPGGDAGPAGRLRHLLPPTVTLALAQAALLGRLQRALLLDVLDSAFLRAARGKGLRRTRATLAHGLRCSAAAMSAYYGYAFGLALLGALFVEQIYGWHGLGEWTVSAVAAGDVHVIAAVGCLAAVLVPAASLLADAARALLDPRVRVS